MLLSRTVRRPRGGRRLAAVAVPALALPLVVAPLSTGTAAAADVPTVVPTEASAGFLLRAQAADGSIGTYGTTADGVVSLVAAGVDGDDAVTRALDFLRTGLDGDYAQNAQVDTIPSATGKLLLAFSAGGVDARSLQGEDGEDVDLVQRLLDTEVQTGADAGRFDAPPSLFDGTTFENDGAFSQSLALLGLDAAAPGAVSDEAVGHLLDLECPGGGFQFAAANADGSGTSTGCEAADTNTTAYAVQALVATRPGAPVEDAVERSLAFLDAAQTSDGGFPFTPGEGAESDPSSTALALQAIVAAGEDPGAGRWVATLGTPASALAGDVIGCYGAPEDRGGLPGFSGDADPFATSQAVPALAGLPLPVPAVAPAALADDTPVLACTGTPRDIRTNACPPDAVPSDRFRDVPRGGTFTLAIECLAATSVAQGTGDGSTFSPSADVTRAQMAVFVHRLLTGLGLDLPATDQGFTDLAGVRPEVRDAVDALATAGVVRGTSATTYSPQALVRRDQMASFLARGQAVLAADAEAGEDVLPFAPGVDDFGDDAGNVHEAAINALSRAGVTTGAATGYDPARSVSRQQMAAFLTRQLDVVLEQRGETGPALS